MNSQKARQPIKFM